MTQQLKRILFLKKSLLFAGFVLFISVVFSAHLFAADVIVKPPKKPTISVPHKKKNFAAKPNKKPAELVADTAGKETTPSFIERIQDEHFDFSSDDDLHKEIFSLQQQGKIKEADKKIKKLSNDLLMGNILAERYLHPTAYKASYKDIASWLEKCSDHPQSQRLYKLALRKKGKGDAEISKPKSLKPISGNLAALSYSAQPYKSSKKRTAAQEKKLRALTRDIKKTVKRNSPTLALNILNSDYNAQFFDQIEYDRLEADIATGFYFAGKYERARQLSQKSLGRSGLYVPQAGWVSGLTLWMTGQYRQAAQSFEIAADSPYASGWMRSAASYWASRAHMRAGNVKEVTSWLKKAAEYPRSFYGILATRALGQKPEFNWSTPSLKSEHIKEVQSTQSGRRAHVLLKAGQHNLAAQELLYFDLSGASSLKKEALIAYASHYDFPDILLRAGNAFYAKEKEFYDAALYPVGGWQPLGGYSIDPALVHAFIRQESRFRSTAQNPSGATGLMQVMPKTANYVTGKNIYQTAEGKSSLKNPKNSLDIGQKYIAHLLKQRAVDNDVLLLAIAYNAGPGNLSKWKQEMSHINDPLLFIESIPFDETRAFVERVMANYWIYRFRFDQKVPSLKQIAEGKWAPYKAQKY